MFKLRVGIILILISWLPFAQVLIYVAHNHNRLTNEAVAQEVRMVIWGIQILIGCVGLWLAGKVAIKTAKNEGWKRMPGKIWHLFWNGHEAAQKA